MMDGVGGTNSRIFPQPAAFSFAVEWHLPQSKPLQSASINGRLTPSPDYALPVVRIRLLPVVIMHVRRWNEQPSQSRGTGAKPQGGGLFFGRLSKRQLYPRIHVGRKRGNGSGGVGSLGCGEHLMCWRRSGTMTIAGGRVCTVTQAAVPGCSYSISPSSQVFAPAWQALDLIVKTFPADVIVPLRALLRRNWRLKQPTVPFPLRGCGST